VNDVGEINLDASLIKASTEKNGRTLKGFVELTSGCICCSTNSDLAESLFSLVTHYQPDHIIVESSGVAEPQNIYASLSVPNGNGQKIIDLLDIQSMITLVNPGYLVEKWELSQESKKRTHLLHSDPRQPLIEMLINQIEFADLIIMTHNDQYSNETIDKAVTIIKSVNDHAEFQSAEFGEIKSKIIFKQRFKKEETSDGVRWRSILKQHEILDKHMHHNHEDHNHEDHNHEHHSHTNYGISTWLYRARRPFRYYDFVDCFAERVS
jgi:G3E family GTPase